MAQNAKQNAASPRKTAQAGAHLTTASDRRDDRGFPETFGPARSIESAIQRLAVLRERIMSACEIVELNLDRLAPSDGGRTEIDGPDSPNGEIGQLHLNIGYLEQLVSRLVEQVTRLETI